MSDAGKLVQRSNLCREIIPGAVGDRKADADQRPGEKVIRPPCAIMRTPGNTLHEKCFIRISF